MWNRERIKNWKKLNIERIREGKVRVEDENNETNAHCEVKGKKLYCNFL